MKRKILNVGCGKETYGTDFMDIYPSREEVTKCDFQREKIPFKNNTFDEVYGRSVLEHLRNPGKFLEECKRVLRNGGKLIIITDNAAYYRFHLKFFKNDIGVHYERYGEKGELIRTRSGPKDKHYFLFTTLHLRNLFLDSGFKIKELKYLNDSYLDAEKAPKKPLDFLFSLVDKRIVYRFIKIVGEKG